MKRALCLSPGGLQGAYTAGVTSTLTKKLGNTYFDKISAVSVGVYSAAFYASDQPEIIRHIYSERVHNTQLINKGNLFKNKPVLQLDHLTALYQTKKTALDRKVIESSPTELEFTLTNKKTFTAEYHKPSRNTIFLAMKASCAIPLIHPPVEINGVAYIDGALSNQLPARRLLDQGYDEIIVVSNKPQGSYVGPVMKRAYSIANVFSGEWAELFSTYEKQGRYIENLIQTHPKIHVIRPQNPLPVGNILDTDQHRIQQTLQRGTSDAYEFLRTYPH